MSEKHGWNERQNYFDIHFKVLRFFEVYMATPVQYHHEVITESHEILYAPKIIFTTWHHHTTVHVRIKKDITIRRPKVGRAEAKTYSYRYHANHEDGRAILRYCSPDDPNDVIDADDHHTFHHKHLFDRIGKEAKVFNTQGEKGTWPHVSDFLNELLQNY